LGARSNSAGRPHKPRSPAAINWSRTKTTGLASNEVGAAAAERFAPVSVCSKRRQTSGYGLPEQSMPFYHFDLINSRNVADEGGAELADDIGAMDSADALARRLLDQHPSLRNQQFAILVTNDDGDEICRVPLDLVH
jgi:hypothetical protein